MRPLPIAHSRAALGVLALVGAVGLLLPFGRWAELPILIGAALGVVACARWRELWRHAAVRALLLATGAYTLAALCSAPDAVAPEKTWVTAWGALRFVAFGLGVMALCQRARADGVAGSTLARAVALVAAIPVLIWVLDGLVQALTGYSLGGTLDADRLSGIFGADDLKLGPLLSVLAPLLLWPALRAKRWQLALLGLGVCVVVLLAGARAGWVSLGLVALLLSWRLARGSWRRMAQLLGALMLVVAVIAASAYALSEHFRARVDRTLLAGAGQLDTALAGRLPIWETAQRMSVAHPVNGVGVRGFRHAYPDYADAGDPWVDPQQHTGAAHAHQLILELLTETGVQGLVLWMIAAAVMLGLWRRTIPGPEAQAPWIALLVLVFPLNTHLAFYSSFMGIVLAWVLTLACVQSLLQPVDGMNDER